ACTHSQLAKLCRAERLGGLHRAVGRRPHSRRHPSPRRRYSRGQASTGRGRAHPGHRGEEGCLLESGEERTGCLSAGQGRRGGGDVGCRAGRSGGPGQPGFKGNAGSRVSPRGIAAM
ncbi:uncharacterized protein METZ01_LOCUS479642, partial [marine metagenome]